jgi:hypothetical protein
LKSKVYKGAGGCQIMKIGIEPDCVSERKLEDGTGLRLLTWISRIVEPGKQMYQLECLSGNVRSVYPENFQNFPKRQAEELYVAIKSKEEFNRLGKIYRA